MLIDTGYAQLPFIAAASVASPPTGFVRLFFDSSNSNRLSQKDSSGAVIDLAASGSGGGTPGGTTKKVQYNNAGAFGGASNVEIDGGDLVLVEDTSPSSPLSSTIKLFCEKIANKFSLCLKNSNGTWNSVQSSIWKKKASFWIAPGSTTSVPGLLGLNTFTALATVTARAVTAGNVVARTKRLGYVSAATAPAITGHYQPQAQETVGSGTIGLGGFFYSCDFNFSDAAKVAGARAFVGLSSSVAAPTNVQPDTLLNCVGVAQMSTDATQMYLVYGGSNAQVEIPLGTGFPPMATTGILGGIAYTLSLYSPPESVGVIHYRFGADSLGAFVEGTLTPTTEGIQTPGSATLLAHRAWRCNNATAAAVGIDISSVYFERVD